VTSLRAKLLTGLCVAGVCGGAAVSAVVARPALGPSAEIDNHPGAADTKVVSATKIIPLEGKCVVHVSVWLSECLQSSELGGDVRVVSVTADFGITKLSLSKAVYFGSLKATSRELVEVSSGRIDTGLASILAAQILDLKEMDRGAAPILGSYVVRVRPVEGRTWATIDSESAVHVECVAERS